MRGASRIGLSAPTLARRHPSANPTRYRPLQPNRRATVAQYRAEHQPRYLCVLGRARCCSVTGPLSEGRWREDGSSNRPGAPSPRGRGRFPKSRFGLGHCEPSTIHGDEYPSNRVARCMRREHTRAADRRKPGRPDGPVCGIVDADFGEFTFRDCPKSLEATCRAALETAEKRCLVLFGLRISNKCTLGALLVPLFGQSFYEVR